MQQYNKKEKVPPEYKTKEELQKLGRIPGGSPVAKLKDKNRIYYLFDINQSVPIPSRVTPQLQPTFDNIAKALFVVNRHAKTSPAPQKLYQLKTAVIEKLLQEGKATKVGLQQSPNPSKFHKQVSNTLVKVGDYGFHILATREDMQTLPHLGGWSEEFRNPSDSFSLRQAIHLLEGYLGRDKEKRSKRNFKK